jgi:hypothetical protein
MVHFPPLLEGEACRAADLFKLKPGDCGSASLALQKKDVSLVLRPASFFIAGEGLWNHNITQHE